MIKLHELGTAFNRYRKKANPRSKRAKYPSDLAKAVSDFKGSNPSISAEDIAREVGVGKDTIERWCDQYYRPSESFAPVKIIDIPAGQNKDEIKISKGPMTISIQADADREQVHKLIEFLVAG